LKIKDLEFLGLVHKLNRVGRTIGYRTFGGRQSFQAQSRIYSGILEKMKTMEKRFGVMAKLDGYELDENDTEGQNLIDQYRKGNDALDLLTAEEAGAVTLDAGEELRYTVDNHSGMATSPAERAAASMDSNVQSPASPPSPPTSHSTPPPPPAGNNSSNNSVGGSNSSGGTKHGGTTTTVEVNVNNVSPTDISENPAKR
jgi:hypothetical protein